MWAVQLDRPLVFREGRGGRGFNLGISDRTLSRQHTRSFFPEIWLPVTQPSRQLMNTPRKKHVTVTTPHASRAFLAVLYRSVCHAGSLHQLVIEANDRWGPAHCYGWTTKTSSPSRPIITRGGGPLSLSRKNKRGRKLRERQTRKWTERGTD